MVAGLLHPLNIFILGLGCGFLIPLIARIGQAWVAALFVLALAGMTLISGVALLGFLNGAPPIEILTGGSRPPYAINLRLGLTESILTFNVSLVALLGSYYVVREKYAVMLLYLITVMGIQGMAMTRDLFNLFVFLEIVSIGTYGLLSLHASAGSLSAAFKYLMATVIASTFFLLGTVLVYASTGMLNIDALIARGGDITGLIGFAGLMFLLGCILIELKPFPANGWGLDVYETAPGPVAALVSVGVSGGVFFTLVNLLPLFKPQLEVIALLGAATFLFSNLIGLQQDKAQRLLGYSSIGQMGLLTIALALLHSMGADAAIPLVIGGLFVNHLFAKAGLFWLSSYVGKDKLCDWSVLARDPAALVVFGVLLVAISGLPPFPGFWAKWQLILSLASGERYIWIAIVLLGSLLEAAYMFRWFGEVVHGNAQSDEPKRDRAMLLPVWGAALLLIAAGYFAAILAGLSSLWVALPLAAGVLLYGLDGLPGRAKGLLTITLALFGGFWLIRDLSGLNQLFAVLLWAGGIVVSLACLDRNDTRPGFFPMLAVLLVSLPALPRALSSLEFFFIWELLTLSSYFLIVRRREAAPYALRYLLFSLAAAFLILAGFALIHAVSGTMSLQALRGAGPDSSAAFLLIAVGLLIKAGAVGVHVWLPGAYAEADDDVSAMLSSVISKVAIFGLLVGTFVAIRSDVGLNLARLLGWIGMATTLAGALMALRQDDIKRMLAYSSMSQLGYIVTAIALMSHLGWVTALYLVANHLMVKGILFLAAAAIIMRVGTRMLPEMGGLARAMPLTFATALFAIVAMSGLPPLAGFGGKWLLLSAMIEKGWYGPIVMGLLATFAGFLYMARFIRVIFLGPRRPEHVSIADAPVALLFPQFLLVAGIVVVSFFPKLLIEPVSQAIDPYFAATLVWQGMSLELIYATWNPIPVMAFAVAVSAVLFAIVWLLHRTGRRPSPEGARIVAASTKPAGFYDFYKPVLRALTPPVARTLWAGLTSVTVVFADRARRIYTGNAQTYSLYVIYYFLVLYAIGGGIVTKL